MPLDPAQLPDDIAELKRLLVAGDAELTARMAELAAAKNGLVITQLTIEKLKAQIARLRREKFGASSERIERTLAQLELALEEAETAKAEAVASAAIRYARSRWQALTRYLDHGRLEISNNAAENQIRPVALGRNYAQLGIMRSCRDGGHESTQLWLWEASSLRSATAHN